MCGICGVYSFDAPLDNPEIIREMADTLAHRGPDGQGFFLNSTSLPFVCPDDELYRINGPGTVALGHRRLSIIDLAGGHQPLTNEDSTIWVTYNGEIYNFRQIRDKLISKGHRFRTDCDTEVIVHAWEEWGKDCVHRFRGMFAFAIWDSRQEILFVVRDRLGIKPLYVYCDGDRFLFASEIKSILASGCVERRIDPQALCDYFHLLYIPAPKSIFQGIRKLPAGHYCMVEKGRMFDPVRYWDISFATVNTEPDEEEWCERLIDKLREAVDLRLISDVPLGAFLSGGVDSSAVVALMSSLMDEPVKTSSIGFRDAAFNELEYVEQVVEQYATEHHQQVMEADAVELLDKLVWFYDEPFADSSAIPTYLVSQMTRERVTVALSGDGGDENFAGYRRYYFDVLENRLRNLFPDIFRTTCIAALARIYPKADWLPQVFRAKTLLSNLAMSPLRGYYNSMSWFSSYGNTLFTNSFRNEIKEYDSSSLFIDHGNNCDSDDPLSRIQYIDIKTYLVDDILTKVDRASMANSLEVRVPLLDHEFMELAATMPSTFKLRGREGKYILKKALEPLLPDSILYRRKMGFSIPLASWMRNDLKELFEDTVLSPSSSVNDYLEDQIVKEIWNQHQSGMRDYAAELWSILFFTIWNGNFLGTRAT